MNFQDLYRENHFLYLLGEEYYVDRYEITNNTTQVIRMTQEIEQREGLGQGQLLNTCGMSAPLNQRRLVGGLNSSGASYCQIGFARPSPSIEIITTVFNIYTN